MFTNPKIILNSNAIYCLSVVKVVNPIQALIVNRLFCMQLDFVKALWWYDKKNSLTNALLIWILVKGIIKEGIFGTENSVDDLLDLKM